MIKRTFTRGFLKNSSLQKLSKCFLLKCTTKIPYFGNIRRTEVNFNSTFSENNMRLPLRRLRMNGNNVGIWVRVFSSLG